jgi:chromosome segregation ATPase
MADLKAYLAEVTQKITGLFRDRDSDRQEFLAQCARTEKDNNRLREQLAEAESRAESVASALEAARATSAEQLARISALEAQLEASREATRKAEERARQLDKDLEDALREIEETERRAGDRVHRAEKEKELGVKTFRFELKKRIQPYLTEVLDDGGEPPELSPDQSRLHQRLRKILGVLRDTGVMGE